jgi:hypothetical protein
VEGAAAAREEDEQYALMNNTRFAVSLFFFTDKDQLQYDDGDLFMHHA